MECWLARSSNAAPKVRRSYRFGRSWIGCLLQWVEVRQVEEGVGLGEEMIDGEEKGVKREEG